MLSKSAIARIKRKKYQKRMKEKEIMKEQQQNTIVENPVTENNDKMQEAIEKFKNDNPEEVKEMEEAGFKVMAVYENEEDIPQELKNNLDFLDQVADNN